MKIEKEWQKTSLKFYDILILHLIWRQELSTSIREIAIKYMCLKTFIYCAFL